MYPFEVQVKLPIINSYNLPQDALSNVIFKLWCHILFMREQTSTSYAELDNPLPSSKHETKWRASMLKTKCSLMEALKSSRDIITAYITIGLTTSCPKELYSIHFKPDFYSTNDHSDSLQNRSTSIDKITNPIIQRLCQFWSEVIPYYML